MRRRTALGAGAAAVVVGGLAAAGLGLGGATGARPPVRDGRPPATARVTRETLTRTERVTGRLDYGRTSTFRARGTGTVTWLPDLGSVVGPGQTVYKVDGRPVVLLTGDAPLYRVLADGVTGPDVGELETNLKAFGYTGFTVDDRFNSATAWAVRRWQNDLGLAMTTGTVDPGQVAVAPGPVRVTEHMTEVGAPADGPVLTYTGTVRVVTIPLEVTRQHLVSVGVPATVTLPDGASVAGVVSAIGTVATTPPGGTGGPGAAAQRATPVVDVVVTIADQASLGTLDEAPVDLLLVVGRRENVLTVPVGALVALAEGGYGVQVVDGATTRYVAVTTGIFAAGRVEVSGDGVAEGMTVGVPA